MSAEPRDPGPELSRHPQALFDALPERALDQRSASASVFRLRDHRPPDWAWPTADADVASLQSTLARAALHDS